MLICSKFKYCANTLHIEQYLFQDNGEVTKIVPNHPPLIGSMPNIPIPQVYFRVPPITNFSKIVQHNPFAPTPKHMNNWEIPLHINGYCVVGVIAIPCPSYRSIITIFFKEGKTYLMFIVDIPYCDCTNFKRMSSLAMGKRGQWVSCKHLHYVFIYVFVEVDYATYEFIHAPTSIYKKVRHLVELANVVEQA